jgi:hypothetical protein
MILYKNNLVTLLAQITITHTSLLSLLQPPLVVAWLQSSLNELQL